MVVYETFFPEGIATLATMFPDLLTTSFPDTSLSPARVQIATALFVPEQAGPLPQ
jgi:phage tail protein X